MNAVPAFGAPNSSAIAFFVLFVGMTLLITWWAARRARTVEDFFAAGRRISGRQNGFALAGDYMSAASFLGITGLVATSGFDGLIYPVAALAGWPLLLFLIAEPLRSLGRYTFTDVVSFRLGQTPVRIAAAIGSLAVVVFYLVAQMVGAGNLIRLVFGLSYEVAVFVVGTLMLVYVLFGGMVATTWVQIVKAALLLGGSVLLSVLVLLRFELNPSHVFTAAAARYGAGVLAPGTFLSSPLEVLSVCMQGVLGTAGLPHILMRFFTVPDVRAARISVLWATGLIGLFYLLIFVLGFGAMALVGRETILAADKGGNMAAPLLALMLGGSGLLGFIGAVAFATILAVVAGLTLSGAAAVSHDLWVSVVRHGEASRVEQLGVARAATVALAILAITLGLLFKGQNVVFMTGLTFAVAASGLFPALLLSILWRKFTTAGAVAGIVTGTLVAIALIALSPTVQIDVLGHDTAPFPLRNPGLLSIPLGFLAAIVVSLLAPEPAARAGYDDARQRMAFGSETP
jgi:cation/acetate symporter